MMRKMTDVMRTARTKIWSIRLVWSRPSLSICRKPWPDCLNIQLFCAWSFLIFLVAYLRLFGFLCFLFLLVSEKGCGLWLWHSLDLSLTFFLNMKKKSIVQHSVPYDAQRTKKALMPYANSAGPDERVNPCSLIWTFSVRRQTTISINSVCGQWRPRSACENAQADQGLRCPQIA